VPEPIYDIRDLTHRYHSEPVLHIPRARIFPGTIVGLRGPNGSGKSTLLKLLGFILGPSGGEIRFMGDIAYPFSEAVRFQVTLLPQTPYLMQRTVFKNVAYGLKLRKDKNHLDKRVYEALAMVGLSARDFANRQSHELSGGEALRVALAARLVLRPRVLLLDEPTASVDAASVERIKEASIRACREWGSTLVVASHDWQWLYEVCDEVIQLFQGQVLGSGAETILFGPWTHGGGQLWEKRLPDGQRIPVSRPPGPDAVAVIGAEALTIVNGRGKSTMQTGLKGVISRLTLERATGRILTTLLVGGLAITAALSADTVHAQGLYPGREVRVGFDLNAMTWLK
jgi:tungstate transport system ATP-binding protein